MKLSIGIVGLPNVGKSTLFKTLTKQEVNIANYPFATIDPNVGVVAVPDERLNKLVALYAPKKVIPAVVELYDIAGLVKGANKGDGLGNKFLAHIRDTQAIVLVLRVFKDSEIVHVENTVDPERDLEIINLELALKDIETIEKRLEKLESDIKIGQKNAEEEKVLLTQAMELLKQGKPIVSLPELYLEIVKNPETRSLNLLTAKKQLYLLNGSTQEVDSSLLEKIEKLNGSYIVVDLKDAQKTAMAQLIQKSYEILGLISFFTVGEDEVRAWTIKKGILAPQAAGVIHTDFEKNFIRAEVINWEKLLEEGGWGQAKQKGLMRLEGKEYVVRDGDVISVRHGA